ncbi:MAG: hypothetical protein ACRD2P_14605 [Terriglobia bacterium]
MIFRVDYPRAFNIFQVWGTIFSTLDACKFWSDLGEDVGTRAIIASGEDDAKNKVNAMNVRVTSIDGVFEAHPISSYGVFDKAFDSANEVLALLEVKDYRRMGIRFIFLQPQETFERAQSLVADQLKATYWELFAGELSDIALVSVHKNEGQNMRLSVGPLNRREYVNWFGAVKEIKPDNALLFDVDCFATDYKQARFDLKKLVALYYDTALRQAEQVLKFLESRS